MNHWADPLLVSDEAFADVWARPAEDPVLLVVGSGFDPRATVVLERLLDITGRVVDCLVVELPEDATDPAVRPLAGGNRRRITELAEQRGGRVEVQALPEFHDGRTLGRLISRHFQEAGHLERHRELILDISALPRSVFFPLIRGILERAHSPSEDKNHWVGDLHVAVCENPDVDEAILEEGTNPMAPVGGFARPQGDAPKTRIWVPVLGERAPARVRRLYEELEPDETCPVVPWPARDPQRDDRLILEYRRLLFEEMRIEARNVIHAAERNPFDLYRTLGGLQDQYRRSLSSLGPVAVTLSSHSSKLLSLGVLLTAYSHDLEVQHVSPGTYGLHDGLDDARDGDEIYDLWLTGEPYR